MRTEFRESRSERKVFIEQFVNENDGMNAWSGPTGPGGSTLTEETRGEYRYVYMKCTMSCTR